MTNTDKFYNSYGLDRSIPRSFLKRQELTNLFAVPKKEQNSEMAHFYNFVEDDTPELRFMRTSAFNSCHIYLPESDIPNRYLSLETGFREGVHPINKGERQERARGSPYKDMTFMRYDVGDNTPSKILEHVHRKLIEEVEGHHNPTSAKANAWVEGEAIETYETMFQHIVKSAEAGGAARAAGKKILIFPSCGTIVPTDPKTGIKVDKAIIDKIIQLQSQSDEVWTRLLGGRSLKNVYDMQNAMYRGERGVDKGAQPVGANKYWLLPKHYPNKLNPFHMALRQNAQGAQGQAALTPTTESKYGSSGASKEGGSRRFVKKSKSKGKNKKNRTKKIR